MMIPGKAVCSLPRRGRQGRHALAGACSTPRACSFRSRMVGRKRHSHAGVARSADRSGDLGGDGIRSVDLPNKPVKHRPHSADLFWSLSGRGSNCSKTAFHGPKARSGPGHPPWAPPRSPVRGIGAGGKFYNFRRSERKLGYRGSVPEFFAKCPIRRTACIRRILGFVRGRRTRLVPSVAAGRWRHPFCARRFASGRPPVARESRSSHSRIRIEG